MTGRTEQGGETVDEIDSPGLKKRPSRAGGVESRFKRMAKWSYYYIAYIIIIGMSNLCDHSLRFSLKSEAKSVNLSKIERSSYLLRSWIE